MVALDWAESVKIPGWSAGLPYLVPQRSAHDGGVAVVADDAEVEDGDGAERDVQWDVKPTEQGAQGPGLAQLQHGARRHHWEEEVENREWESTEIFTKYGDPQVCQTQRREEEAGRLLKTIGREENQQDEEVTEQWQ